MATLRGGPVTRQPSTRISPSLGGMRPSRQRMNLLLLEPDGSTSPTISRWPTQRLMFRKTSSEPKRLLAPETVMRGVSIEELCSVISLPSLVLCPDRVRGDHLLD